MHTSRPIPILHALVQFPFHSQYHVTVHMTVTHLSHDCHVVYCAQNENPLYRSAAKDYENPLYGK